MIIRHYVKCLTCDTSHTLRISVGGEKFQEHSFQCKHCGENIFVRQVNNFETPVFSIDNLNNCAPSENEGHIVNLHPHFVLSREAQSDPSPTVFISEQMRILQKNPEFLNVFTEIDMPSDVSPDNILNILSPKKKGRSFAEEWPFIRTAWSLYINGKSQQCYSYIEKNYKLYGLDEHPHPTFLIMNAAINVGRRCGAQISGHLAGRFEAGATANPDMLRLIEWMPDRHLHVIKLALDLLSEYMANIQTFRQVAAYLDFSVDIPVDYNATSSNFDAVRMYYGRAFECFNKIIDIPVAVENLADGRKYDKLENGSLAAFMKKANFDKCSYLLNKDAYKEHIQLFNNRLRNSSHHGDIEFNSDARDVEFGKASSREKMSFANYIKMCTGITQLISGIVAFDIWCLFVFPHQEAGRTKD